MTKKKTTIEKYEYIDSNNLSNKGHLVEYKCPYCEKCILDRRTNRCISGGPFSREDF